MPTTKTEEDRRGARGIVVLRDTDNRATLVAVRKCEFDVDRFAGLGSGDVGVRVQGRGAELGGVPV